MEDIKLKEYFNFDEADLLSNRDGRFSERQNELIRAADREFKKGMRRSGIPLLLVAAIGPVAAIIGGQALGLIWILVWGILWTIIWGFFGLGLVQGSFSKTEFEFCTAKGPIKIVRTEGYDSKRRKDSIWNDLRIGRRHFEIQENLADVMTNGDEYVIYYQKDLNKIMALELIKKAETQSTVAAIQRTGPVDFEAEAKKLRKYFQFTEADLTANRSGVLSDKQKKRIKNEAGSLRGAALVIGVILLVVAVAGVIGFGNAFGFVPALIWGLIWGGAGIFLVVLSITSAPQFKLLNVRGQANLVKGETSSTKHHRSSVYYDLQINGHEFDGDRDHLLNAMIQDAEYIVYYTQGAERIVSVELISTAN